MTLFTSLPPERHGVVMDARAMKPDNSELYEFEITGFELLEPGVRYD